MALTVKSRRTRSPSRESPNIDLGLARRAVVAVGAVGRDLDACAPLRRPIVPNSRPMSQCASAQPADDREDLVGPGVGREVEVGRDPTEERVTHRAADERQLVPGPCEPLAELGQHRQDGGESGDGGAQERQAGVGGLLAVGTGVSGRSGTAQPSERPRGPTACIRGGSGSASPPRRLLATTGGATARRLWWRCERAARPPPLPGRRLPAVEERSAGGIVVDVREGLALIAIIARRNRAGRIEWCLPKGHVEPGETLVEAAAREVAEETGIVGRVLVELGTIDYWFATSSTRVHKFVHHYLLEATGGELSIENDPDHEAIDVAWMRLDEVHRSSPSPTNAASRRRRGTGWRGRRDPSRVAASGHERASRDPPRAPPDRHRVHAGRPGPDGRRCPSRAPRPRPGRPDDVCRHVRRRARARVPP